MRATRERETTAGGRGRDHPDECLLVLILFGAVYLEVVSEPLMGMATPAQVVAVGGSALRRGPDPMPALAPSDARR